jgi:transcriptional regulator with XRE-family HTH domain
LEINHPKFGYSPPKFVPYKGHFWNSSGHFWYMKGHFWNMNRQTCINEGQELWRKSLNELRNRTGVSYKQIADKENLSEKAVSRVFSGEAKNPGVDLIRRIIHALGGTWSEVFAESSAVIGSQDLVTLQAEVNRLGEENALLASSLNIANLDLAAQKDKVTALESEIKILRLKLEYEEKLVAVHNFYNKLNPNN